MQRQHFILHLGLTLYNIPSMKKYCILFILSFLSVKEIYATHISGGEMSYIYLGPGTSPGTLKYSVTLRMYKDCHSGGATLDDIVVFTVFNTLTNAQVRNIKDIPGSPLVTLQKIPNDPCIPDSIEQEVCFFTRTYTTIIDDLPANSSGYTVTYQRCCRVAGMQNITSLDVGVSYFAKIPGNSITGAETNTSPVFGTKDTVLICSGKTFNFDFGATDADNDTLRYSFYNAFSGGGNTTNPSTCLTCTSPDPSAAPPYNSTSYINGYTPSFPLGNLVVINPNTGLISGIAPNLGLGVTGIFAITVLVSEFRNGVKIGEHFKDLQIRVGDCQITSAVLNPKPTTCDGFTVNFQNDFPNNPEPLYFWDFGEPSSTNNTSILSSPSHTYAAAGDYTVKLYLNRNSPCGDSTQLTVKVYPGFFPDFDVLGSCKNTAIQFLDKSTANYGSINFWRWNFGDPTSTNNTSTIKNPTHTYAAAANYNVEFIVASDKGCIDTLTRPITITDKPAINAGNDTLICIIDTLQLNAIGTGSFLWSPNYNINNVNIFNPLVSPDVTTTYRVTLTDPFGCVGSDSVKVSVVSKVNQFAPNDTTICTTDGVLLRLTSDALNYQWTEIPAGNTLSNPKIKTPVATPVTSTVYHVVGSIGKCTAENDIRIKTVPYPNANAGLDQTICFGFSAQLNASGGSSYSWSPTAFLNNRLIPNPVSINPTANIRYIVSVTDTLGCPKPARDTVFVNVAKITADAGPRDTSVVLDQPLLLNATGSTNYLWSPAQWLSSTTIHNPVSLPQNDIEYIVKVSNNFGCFDYDSIRVHLYKLDAGIYVPTAFTPNGDGKNDIFRPIILGITSLDLFRVYNRWGQLLYSGTDAEKGWDGTFGGKGQDAATYVWYAEATDYRNRKLKKKGYVVLIR